jgi:hypothetical protein
VEVELDTFSGGSLKVEKHEKGELNCVLGFLKLFQKKLKYLRVCSGLKHKERKGKRNTQEFLYRFLSQVESTPVPLHL